MSNIDKIKDRIKAIMLKANNSAASEAEAKEALAMAMKLSAKYGVSMDDLDKENVTFEQAKFNSGAMRENAMHEVDQLLGVPLANFVGVKVWKSDGGNMNVLGTDADVELFKFLRHRLKDAMDFEYAIYLEYVHEGPRVGARRGFMSGFASRIRERIDALKVEVTQYDKTHNALVVKKADLVEKEMERRGIILGKSYGRRGGKSNADAYAAGASAGGRADMGRGVVNTAGYIGR